MKLCANIVDDKRRLIGFLVAQEFNGNGPTTKLPMTVAQMVKEFGTNGVLLVPGQVELRGSRVVTQGKFKLSDLPMVMASGKEFVQLDNKMTAVARINRGGAVMGFRIRFADGYETNLKTNDVVLLSSWIKPTNFITRKRDDGSWYLCAPAGKTLAELPQLDVDEMLKVTNKPKHQEKAVAKEDLDFLSFMFDLSKSGGCIIKMRRENKKEASSGVVTNEAFEPMPGVSIGWPWVGFTDNKLNATVTMRKYGKVEALGRKITTYVPVVHSVIKNGELVINRMVIGLKGGLESHTAFQAKYGAAFNIQEFKGNTDPAEHTKRCNDVKMVLGDKSWEFYSLELLNVPVLAPSKIDSGIVKNLADLNPMIVRWLVYKLQAKYCSSAHGIVAAIKKKNGADFVSAIMRENVNEKFRELSEQGMQEISKAGIDIYTGEFKLRQYEKAAKGEEEDGIEIRYFNDICDVSKITFKVMDEMSQPLPERIEKLVLTIQSEKDERKKVEMALRGKKEADEQLDKIRTILWKHKYCMIKKYAGKVHSHDKDAWRLDTSRKRKNKMYKCVRPEFDGLSMECSGTEV